MKHIKFITQNSTGFPLYEKPKYKYIINKLKDKIKNHSLKGFRSFAKGNVTERGVRREGSKRDEN